MPITWAYNAGTNTATASGAGSTNFAALVAADKAGTLDLESRTGISNTDGSAVNLDYNLRPADLYVLGGAAQDLYVVVSSWSSLSQATIRITGTDSAGSAQTEDFNFTGNATKYATKYFKTLTSSQVTLFDSPGAGKSFAYTVTQGQWGVFSADATGTQISCAGKIIIGDGTAGSTTLLADSSKEIIFTAAAVSADYTYLLYVREYASLKLGNVVDATTKSTNNGVTIISLQNNYNSISMLMSRTTAGTTELYSCTFEGLYRRHFIRGYVGGEAITAFNCITDYVCFQALTTDFFNINAVGRANTFPMLELLGGTLNILRVSNAVYGYWQTSTATADSTISGYYARNITKFGYFAGSKNVYFVNPDSSSWVFTYSTFTGKVYRQYEFDLQVCDNAESELQGTVVPIEGADVTLFDKDGNEVFNATSGADGWIATQTVSRGYYAQATGDTLQDYGPHFLLVTKEGYEPYMDEYILTEKRTNQISMNYPGVPADLATATPTDVLTSKTFFGKAGTLQTGTLVQKKGGGVVFVPQEVEVPNKQEKNMKELIKVLIQQKQFLRKQKIEQTFEPNKIAIN